MDYEVILAHVSEEDMLILLGIGLFLLGGLGAVYFDTLVWLRMSYLTAFTGVLLYTAGMLGLARGVRVLGG